MDYNDEQLQAINCSKKVVIVPAGPGSGKSHTLVGRIVKRAKERYTDPARIAVMTFTNNAARVFAERLAKHKIRVGYMGTLHGYCMRLIQDYGSLLGYRQGFVSITTDEAAALLLDQIKTELRKKITDKELEARESNDAKLIWQEYDFRLKRANMVDYDGILRDGLALLKRDSVKQLAQVDELLVDERQDSGAIDTQIFWEIPATTRFFVGDVDQCIFGFRGARPDLFVDEATIEGWISLEKNYRSDKEICRVANNLIAHNKNRVPKTIKPMSKEDGQVIGHSFKRDGDEIYGVWSHIKEEALNSCLYSDMAVLCRTNAIADKFRETLRGLGVPIAGGERQRMPDDWAFALSLIGLQMDPANDFHAESILRARGIPQDKINELKTKAAKDGRYLSTVSLLPNTRPASVIDGMIILNALLSRESFNLIASRVKVLPDNSTLSDLLVDLWHRDGWTEQKKNGDPGLTVTTIHGAKGSEWSVVFMVAMEEGVFPSKQSMQMVPEEIADFGIEEERRLCFVGVTRAKHRLYLTWVRKRTAFFKTTDQQPSRFLAEMGMPQQLPAGEPNTGGYEIPAEERL
jgi:DNA helicase-2/ATP-dependent DNA helicase PcrA